MVAGEGAAGSLSHLRGQKIERIGDFRSSFEFTRASPPIVFRTYIQILPK
jgi:hypothetical protein